VLRDVPAELASVGAPVHAVTRDRAIAAIVTAAIRWDMGSSSRSSLSAASSQPPAGRRNVDLEM
jgi:hypothetical protein